MAQHGYKRTLKALCGNDVAPTCTDPAQNKVMQLLALFHSVYNLTLHAEKNTSTAEEADTWFDHHLAPWDKADLLLSVAPSARPAAADLLAERLTRIFLESTPDAPLQDLVPTREADAKAVITLRLTRLRRHAEEDQRLDALMNTEPEDRLRGLIKTEQSFWVLSQLLRSADLPAPAWRIGIEQLQHIANTGVQTVEILLIEMEHLLELPASAWPDDIQTQMATLLAKASDHPDSEHWHAPLQRVRAHHLLRQNDLDGALEAFKAARTVCMKSNFGGLRVRIAEEGFATAIGIQGLAKKHFTPFYRDLIRLGPFVDGMPAPQDLAPQAESHFREKLRRLYPGVLAIEEAKERRRTDAFQSLLRVIMQADTAGLDDWLQANAKVFRKALFGDVRSDSLTLRLLKWLDPLEKLAAAAPQEPSVSDTIHQHREAVARIVKAWPEQADMADFKGQTPLMLVADAGDSMLTTLLAELSDVDQQDYRGRTALHAAVASRSLECVSAILEMRPDTWQVTKGENNTALHTAVRFGQPDCVRLIVDEFPELASRPNAHGLNPPDLAQDIRRNHEAWRTYMARENRTTGSKADFDAILALLQSSTEAEATSPATSAPA